VPRVWRVPPPPTALQLRGEHRALSRQGSGGVGMEKGCRSEIGLTRQSEALQQSEGRLVVALFLENSKQIPVTPPMATHSTTISVVETSNSGPTEIEVWQPM
jgi:hypothetical protein